MNPTERDRLLALFRHAAADGPAAGPHVAEDEELLTAWQLGGMSLAEDALFHEHLAGCAACRRYVAELAAAAPPPAAEHATVVPAEPTPAKFPWRGVLGVVAALAACVLLVVGWLGMPTTEAREVARAEAEFNEGKPEAALVRLLRIPPERLTAKDKERRMSLLEQAAYQTIRGDLGAGNFDAAVSQYTVVSAVDVHSSRLDGLRVLAEHRLPLRPALTGQSGSLLERGYLPDGSRSRTPQPLVPNDTLRAAWDATVKANPTDPAVLVNAGEFLLSQGDLSEAGSLFLRAVSRDENNLAGHLGLGLTAVAREQFDKALPHFRRAVELAPEWPAVWIDTAVCYEGLKNPDAARSYWEQALARTTDPKIRDSIAKHLKKG
jgi:tetratricopeptide (TPR) repeat protein